VRPLILELLNLKSADSFEGGGSEKPLFFQFLKKLVIPPNGVDVSPQQQAA